ncbi:MAG: hypothetical protein VB013_12480 [Anaerolineaceae bacterium]|nr:hypothetical protein [Anaerolineaceae bacterium]
MNTQGTPHKKKVFVTRSFKYLIAAFSVVSTLGLWGILSKQDVQALNNSSTQSNPDPLPTLMTLTDVQVNTSTASTTSSDPLALLPVATQPPAQTSYTNTTTSIEILQPNPVTTTRSSRK